MQYSHYIGGYLSEILSAIDLSNDDNLSQYMDGEEATKKYWEEYGKQKVSELRDLIGHLDELNEMKY